MTERELKEYGVEVEDGHYYIPCEICGRKIRRTQFSLKRTYVCDYCKGLIKEKQKASIPEELLNVKTKHEIRFDNAVEEIKQQVKNFDAYSRAINIARTACESFGSIPEAMVAIELLRLKHKIIPQQKIGKYRVDFALPNVKRIIEVDGGTFHRGTDGEREAFIQLRLGYAWKIIHVPAELIRNDIQKLSQVLKLYDILD